MEGKREPQYPEPEWFAEQLYELRSRTDALLRLAKTHGIELKEVYPTRKNRITLKEAAYQTLKQAGKPLHLEEILTSVAEMGAPAGGRRPSNTLHATLSQHPKVKLVGVNTWALVEEEETGEDTSRPEEKPRATRGRRKPSE